MVEVKIRIPQRYYDVVVEMVNADIDDSINDFLSRAIISDVDAMAESPDFLRDTYRTRWLEMLKE